MAVTVRQTRKSLAQVLTVVFDLFEKCPVLHAVEHHQTGRGHQCVAVMSAAQFPGIKAAGLASGQQRCQRHTTTEALAEYDNIGAHTVGLLGEQTAAAADTGLHFVEDQQNAQFAAQPFNAFE